METAIYEAITDKLYTNTKTCRTLQDASRYHKGYDKG